MVVASARPSRGGTGGAQRPCGEMLSRHQVLLLEAPRVIRQVWLQVQVVARTWARDVAEASESMSGAELAQPLGSTRRTAYVNTSC